MVRKLRHLLLRVPDHDLGVINARYTAADVNELEVGVDADDSKVLSGDALATQSASHLLSGPDTTGVLTRGRISHVQRTGVEDVLDGHQLNLRHDAKRTHRD